MTNKYPKTNIMVYDIEGNLIKAHFDVKDWQINDNGWIYIVSKFCEELVIYNKDSISKIEVDHDCDA